jgi:hypothetical protein
MDPTSLDSSSCFEFVQLRLNTIHDQHQYQYRTTARMLPLISLASLRF